jgi:predicted RNA binding protein YcfA (HicA-like mRNA interferase family)
VCGGSCVSGIVRPEPIPDEDTTFWNCASRRAAQTGRVRVRDLIKILHEDDWRLARWRGSHRQYQHPVERGTVTVSGNTGSEVTPGTLISVLKQAGLKKEERR